MDRRTTPFSGQVALNSLRGQIESPRFTDGVTAQIGAPIVDLLTHPGGEQAKRDRQLLWGAGITEIERRDGFAFVQATYDGYCGWIRADAIIAPQTTTHRVCAPATHIYAAPDLKSPDRMSVSLGSRVEVLSTAGNFSEVTGGWIPSQHLSDTPATDPVAVSESLLGTPYLWGGNSRFGIDCSGLVQIGMAAAGRPCAGDSDLQRAAYPPTTDTPKRGDLMFWRGHVAWVADNTRILHATGAFMAVVYEGIDEAIARIEQQGGGPLLGHHRP